MFSELEVTTPASELKLMTLAQLKLDLGVTGTDDDVKLTRVLEIVSEEIAIYLRRGVDESENISLGRETITETFYDIYCEPSLLLRRWPVGDLTSVSENGVLVNRLLSASDASITATETTLTTVADIFASNQVGRTITVAGAGTGGGTLTTTIASFTSATEVELTDAAVTTVGPSAAITIVNPAFDVYKVRKQRGEIIKRQGSVTTKFLTEPVVVVYTAGWLLPGETGRNLPKAIENAAGIYARQKLQIIDEGDDFAGPLTEASIDLVGQFKFASSGASMQKSDSIPFEVRNILDRFREPVLA